MYNPAVLNEKYIIVINMAFGSLGTFHAHLDGKFSFANNLLEVSSSYCDRFCSKDHYFMFCWFQGRIVKLLHQLSSGATLDSLFQEYVYLVDELVGRNIIIVIIASNS